MRLLGLEIGRATDLIAKDAAGLQTIDSRGSWISGIRESFTGAWQKNVVVEPIESVLKFSAVYAAVTLISEDIAKLRIKLMQQDENGIWSETTSPAYSPVLRKPNRYQTRIQFLSQWITSKLLHGNTYILKERDARQIVVALYILDPRRVTPLVASDGSVYYRLGHDILAGVFDGEATVLPASEIIHDRSVTFFHPLVGISPIYACGMAATQGIRIQANSAAFFENASRPSGILTAPGKIPDDVALRLKNTWEANYSAGSIGRLAVLGNDLSYQAMTIPANDAQLIEQLRWTVEDVARCFHIPSFKLNNGNPTFTNVGAMNQDYYTQTLQSLIESIELLLDEGLGLDGPNQTYGTELDLDGLLRMDPLSRADTAQKLVGAGIQSPNEARLKENLPAVVGGDSPLLQMQNYSLEALAKRDAQTDPFAPQTPPQPTANAAPDPAQVASDAAKQMRDLIAAVKKGLEHV